MSGVEALFQLRPRASLGNRYRLDRCLGDGTYGLVWKAERLDGHEVVALKIPKAQGGRNADLEEGRDLLGKPPHPNVIGVTWMGRVPPYREVFVIEMEYFESHTLAFILDSGEQRYTASYRHLLDIYRQVLDGVCHLHGLGITHGDLKPQNILVRGDLAKITDFGSSLHTEDVYARTRDNGGTILYSPPEYAGLTTRGRDRQLAIAHDVYSLGVLLYQLLTGRLPHDTLAQVVRHTPFPRPSEVSSTVCNALESVVMRALAHDPASRWQSVAELRSSFLAGREQQLRVGTGRVLPGTVTAVLDWSSRVLESMDREAWRDAEAVARVEYQASHDPFAFLLMVRAAARDNRPFDVVAALEESPEVLDVETQITGDVEQLALDAYLRIERVFEAAALVNRCLTRQGDRPGLLLRKASILGLQARYREASEILLRLNRELPRRPAILRRLVMVFEQLRDAGMAASFRSALEQTAPGVRAELDSQGANERANPRLNPAIQDGGQGDARGDQQERAVQPGGVTGFKAVPLPAEEKPSLGAGCGTVRGRDNDQVGRGGASPSRGRQVKMP